MELGGRLGHQEKTPATDCELDLNQSLALSLFTSFERLGLALSFGTALELANTVKIWGMMQFESYPGAQPNGTQESLARHSTGLPNMIQFGH